MFFSCYVLHDIHLYFAEKKQDVYIYIYKFYLNEKVLRTKFYVYILSYHTKVSDSKEMLHVINIYLLGNNHCRSPNEVYLMFE